MREKSDEQSQWEHCCGAAGRTLSSKVCDKGSVAEASAEGSHLPCLMFLSFVSRFDEAALSIQKEKNIYKEIENYPTCYKVLNMSGLALL